MQSDHQMNIYIVGENGFLVTENTHNTKQGIIGKTFSGAKVVASLCLTSIALTFVAGTTVGIVGGYLNKIKERKI